MKTLKQLLEADKLLHFIAGAAIMLLVGTFSLHWGAIAVMMAAFGKEAYDIFFRYGFDSLDAIATIIGGVAGGLSILYIFLLI